MLELEKIRIDGGTQSRVELSQEVVNEYADAYRAGVQFPAVTVFFDGTDRWLADGFHRYFGAKTAGQTQIFENVIPGTQRDAIKYSLSANPNHGLRRTNADKRKAVTTALADAEWSAMSDVAVARLCGVSSNFVGDMRRIIHPIKDEVPAPPLRIVERNGKAYELNTENIGRAASATVPVGIQASKPVTAAVPKPAHQPPADAPAPAGPRAPEPPPAAEHEPTVPVSRVAALEDEVVALREQLRELQDDNVSMARVFEASDQLVTATLEAKEQRDLARGLQARINSLMTEVADLKRQVASWKKKASVAA